MLNMMLLLSAVSACTSAGVTKRCTFPFIYKGVLYSKCTRKDASKPWCATKTDGNGNYVANNWAFCGACKKNYICPSTCSKSASPAEWETGDCNPPGSRTNGACTYI